MTKRVELAGLVILVLAIGLWACQGPNGGSSSLAQKGGGGGGGGDGGLSDDAAIAAVRAACHGTFKNHGQCVSCVAHALNALKANDQIAGEQHGDIVSLFARGECTGNCIATDCAILGANCGTLPDGCGGTLNCGTCTLPQTCGGGGTPNVCGCTPTTCALVGANCGTIADGCGGTLDCGTCVAPDTCGGGGRPNVCGTSSDGGTIP
jgi:hypothetical protein